MCGIDIRFIIIDLIKGCTKGGGHVLSVDHHIDRCRQMFNYLNNK